VSTANLTDWQAKQVQLFREDIGKCESIQSLVSLYREFITLSSQAWYVRGCSSVYRKKLDDLRSGKPPRLILAIDLKAIAWLAHVRAMKRENGSGVTEFLEIMKEIKSEPKFAGKYSHIVFADECESGGWRYAATPEWKSKRQEAPGEFVELMVKIRAALEKWGSNVIRIERMEADDILSSIAASYALAGDKVCMICQDKDLYQVLGPQTNMYWTGQFFTRETLMQKHNLEASQWVDYLCLSGKNDVTGAAGIGDVYAKKLLMTFGSFSNCCSSYKQMEKQFSKKIADSVIAFEEQYPLCKRVHSLVQDLEIEVLF